MEVRKTLGGVLDPATSAACLAPARESIDTAGENQPEITLTAIVSSDNVTGVKTAAPLPNVPIFRHSSASEVEGCLEAVHSRGPECR